MKQFMLTGTNHVFNQADKTYQVWLGNRAGIKFYSKRQLNYFIAETNRFLTMQMVELNIYYKELFCNYRDCWFLLYNFKNGKPVNLAASERKIEKSLQDTADAFSRAGNSYRGSSSGGWAFKFMENICLYMLEATDELIAINKKRNNTIIYHNLTIIRENINRVADRIFKYPEVLPEGCAGMQRN